MDLRHLRYFLAVAEHRNFTQAAAALHMTQPPLSRAISELEAEVGAKLLERTTRRVRLTAAGEVFRTHARSVLEALDTAKHDAARADSGHIGHLAVGFTGSVTYELLPRIVRHFRDVSPGVTLDLQGELFTPEQARRIADGRLDVGILRPPTTSPDLEVRSLRSEPLVALLPEDHPLAHHSQVELSELADEDFVSYPSRWQSVLDRTIREACWDAGFQPRIVQEVHETFTLVCLVAAGLGVALVPESVRHLHVTGVAYRPLTDATKHADLAIAWRRSDLSPALSRFVRLVENLIRHDPDERQTPVNGVAAPTS